jgi:phage terminase large subunit-like protein
LTALVASGNANDSATTKEEILRLFVRKHEQAAEHAEALLAILHGCHTDILVALASHMTEIDATALAEADARRVVTLTLSRAARGGATCLCARNPARYSMS